MDLRRRRRNLEARHVVALLLPALALVSITFVDRSVRGDPVLWRHAAADEIAHLATACICLRAATVLGARLSPAIALVSAVVIDIDHVPLLLGLIGTPDGTTRPISHSVAAVAVAIALGPILPGRWTTAASIGFGIVTHLVRDLGTGAVALWWPVSGQAVAIPYAVYFVAIVALTMIATVASRAAGRRSAQRATGTHDVAWKREAAVLALDRQRPRRRLGAWVRSSTATQVARDGNDRRG